MPETVEPLSLDLQQCRQRQKRVLAQLESLDADRAILVRPEHVQYLTGFRPHRLMAAAVVLEADGHCTLAAPNREPDEHAADEVVTFEAQWHATLRQDQPEAVAEVLAGALGPRPAPQRVAMEACCFGPFFCVGELVGDEAEMVDLEPELWSLRRRKDPDELAMIRRAIQCTEAMYARAREIIQPGISEIEVFNQLHAAAVEVAGEPLTDLGNDFRCGAPGGSPRNRAAEAGELYILDLGPAYRGYYADNCRTFAVSGSPTDAQQSAWKHVVAVLDMVAETVRPGVKCRDVFEKAQEMLDAYRPGAFFHHLGHGIGLFPHEGPHLNPSEGWDDTFEQGDVFTAEPGLYGPELNAGIRLEENYLVTSEGLERLTGFPLDL
jgi:Xaa-Pro dipeptidase